MDRQKFSPKVERESPSRGLYTRDAESERIERGGGGRLSGSNPRESRPINIVPLVISVLIQPTDGNLIRASGCARNRKNVGRRSRHEPGKIRTINNEIIPRHRL